MCGVSEQVMQMDVLATADGTPVVFHDINMKRATGEDIDIRTVRRLSHCLAKLMITQASCVPKAALAIYAVAYNSRHAVHIGL